MCVDAAETVDVLVPVVRLRAVIEHIDNCIA